MGPQLSGIIQKKIHENYDLTEDDLEYPNCKDYKKNVHYNGKLNIKEIDKSYLPVSYCLLQPGHVLTIEPGIYFIDVLIDKMKTDETKSKYFDFDLISEYRVSLYIF